MAGTAQTTCKNCGRGVPFGATRCRCGKDPALPGAWLKRQQRRYGKRR